MKIAEKKKYIHQPDVNLCILRRRKFYANTTEYLRDTTHEF